MKVLMRPKGSPRKLEQRRRRAIRLLKGGQGVREVARAVRASPGSVSVWKSKFDKRGLLALSAKPHPGPIPKLRGSKLQRLVRLLKKGPATYGFARSTWTLRLIALVIRRKFRVRYDISALWYLFKRLGWIPHGPSKRH
jgi:transposase